MQQYPTAPGRDKEGQLWLLSLVLAVIVILCVFFAIGLLSLHSHLLSQKSPRPFVPQEQVVIVLAAPEQAPAVLPPEPSVPEKSQPRFTHTSADQVSAPPEKADFIGNHDTIATSDALPVAGAPNLPSQSGRDLPNRVIETTESHIQDGKLENDAKAQAMSQSSPAKSSTAAPLVSAETAPPTPASDSPPASDDSPPAQPPDKPKQANDLLLKGDQVVERPPMNEEEIKPTVAKQSPTPSEQKPEQTPAELPKPKQDPQDPGFRGNQTKTKLSGSISRKGRSALNVANTAMGRYQASLSRAVEAEWHKNCIKYRDFITPGILTIRFVIAPDGGVRSISVVEMVDAGEVQKGFTLGSIRQAKIPPIPADLKAELEGEPIELIYNFYF